MAIKMTTREIVALASGRKEAKTLSQRFISEKVNQLCLALDCSAEIITRAVKDCGLECSEHPDAREDLRKKLDHMLDRIARHLER